MELTKKVPTTDKNQENNHLLRMLDRGIDDMEACLLYTSPSPRDTR
mgnify:CR=1 FL=1